jgi:predicted acyl esterase
MANPLSNSGFGRASRLNKADIRDSPSDETGRDRARVHVAVPMRDGKKIYVDIFRPERPPVSSLDSLEPTENTG